MARPGNVTEPPDALPARPPSAVSHGVGLAGLGAASGPVTGKRVSNARLRGTGWSPRFPDWRSGYASLPA